MFSSKVLFVVFLIGAIYGAVSFLYEVFQKKEAKDKIQLSLSLVIVLICSVTMFQIW